MPLLPLFGGGGGGGGPPPSANVDSAILATQALVTPTGFSGEVITAGGKKLAITDPEGLLSQNPLYWPEELKRAIAECCCGQSSGPPPVDNPCCPGLKLAQVLRGNVKNTVSHDTGLSLRYFGNALIAGTRSRAFGAPSIHPDWIPVEAFPHGSIDGYRAFPPAWYSNLIEDFQCNYDVSGSFIWNGSGFPRTINWRAVYTVSVFYYVVFGWGPPQGIATATGCIATLFQVTYPAGTITYTPNFPSFGIPESQEITWRMNIGLPGAINANTGLLSVAFGLTAVTGGMYTGSELGFLCNRSINCVPFSFREPFSPTAFSGTNVFSSVVTACPTIVATSGAFLGATQTSSEPSTEPPGSCNTPPFDPAVHPLIEVFP